MTFMMHLDGDSFFVACEVALNPKLRGLPVITGQERGIATAMSTEAKRLGIHRGMPVFKIKKLYPQVIICNSNYHTYGMFAQRMYGIVRRFTDDVEEYSIDEAFALVDSVETGREVKETLKRELGLTFSIGLAPTKVLAKVASKWNKPDGFTVLTESDIKHFLEDLPVGKVWGIGPASSLDMNRKGLKTALEFIEKPEQWVKENFSKPHLEIWHELRGETVFGMHSGPDEDYKSVQKTRTFTPPSTNKDFLFSELSKNIESACAKLRRNNLYARRVYYFLKTQEFKYHRLELVLTHPTNAPIDVLNEVRRTLDHVYRPNTPYRASGVTLSGLTPLEAVQNDLFGEVVKKGSWDKIFNAVDMIDRRYGSHTMMLGSSMRAHSRRGGAVHKRLKIPFLGEVV